MFSLTEKTLCIAEAGGMQELGRSPRNNASLSKVVFLSPTLFPLHFSKICLLWQRNTLANKFFQTVSNTVRFPLNVAINLDA